MKGCKNNCEQWRIGVGKLGPIINRKGYPCIYNTPLGIPQQINNCPWCDSGKLIDKEAEFKKEFWEDLYIAARENEESIIFDKYKITKREKSDED